MRRLIALLLLALFTLDCAWADDAITDDAGVTTEFTAPPERIVSLLPSLTETVCALGACDRLVGVDRYSDWPAQVRKLRNVGDGLAPNIEAVVALRPDLVLMGVSARAADRLRALGLKVLELEPHTIADADRATRVIAQALAVPGANALIRRMDQGIAAAAARIPPAARGERVYFEVSPAPYAAGTSGFVGELLQRLDLHNIVPPDLGPFPKINPEFVVAANPALIMASNTSAAEFARRPGWGSIAAIRDHVVCDFDAAQRDILVRPGPRMAEAAALMADCATDPARFRGAAPR